MTLLAAAALAPAGAQEIPIVQAGAGGRYERQVDPRTAVPGVSAATVRQFRGGLDAITAQLAAMPPVHAPPSPVCHRLKTFIETVRPHGILSGEVAVMSPIGFQNGRCHAMTGGGVEIRLNRLDSVFERNRAFVEDPDGGDRHWYVLAHQRLAAGRYRLPDGSLILTHGRPLLAPVSAGRYAQEQARLMGEGSGTGPREWSKLLASMTPAQAAQPACLAPSMLTLVFERSCPTERQVVEVHPGFFDTGSPATLQVMILKTPQRPYHGESRERHDARMALWRAIDIDRLAQLLGS